MSAAPAVSSEARAAAAAALLCGSSAALARLGGVVGDEARALAAAWAAGDRTARARGIAEAALAVRATVPLGLALVHRDWIEAALAGEGARVRAVIAGAAPAPPEVRAWLERRVLGRFVGMPRAIAWPPAAALVPETLAAAPPDWLERALVRAGTYQLAHATIIQPRAAVASLAARLGAAGPAFVDAIAEIDAAGDGATARWGLRRAAIARVSGAAFGEDALALAAIGARAFAGHLRGDAPRQLAQRLPRGLGLRVAAELARGAPGAGDPAPWAELISSA